MACPCTVGAPGKTVAAEIPAYGGARGQRWVCSRAVGGKKRETQRPGGDASPVTHSSLPLLPSCLPSEPLNTKQEGGRVREKSFSSLSTLVVSSGSRRGEVLHDLLRIDRNQS